MKLRGHWLLGAAVLVASAAPVAAQVDKIAMRTTGISCGLCAGLSEFHFKRMDGVDKVDISLSHEAIMLTYKAGAAFSPKKIRELLEPLQVGVVQFQISARGQVQEQGGKRFFLAGKNKFVVAVANAPTIPIGKPVAIEAVLNDQLDPMEVRILNFKPLQP